MAFPDLETPPKKFDIFQIVKNIKEKYGDTKDFNMREILASEFNKDFTEDYPVGEHTRKGGKVKVKAHTRGEVLTRMERDAKWLLKSKKERTIEGLEYENPAKKIGKKVFQLADVISLKDFKTGNESDEETMASLIDDLKDRYEGRRYNYRFEKRKYHVEVWRTYDFTGDYPVEGYTKKDGTKVKKHERKLSSKQNIFKKLKELKPYQIKAIENLIKLRESSKPYTEELKNRKRKKEEAEEKILNDIDQYQELERRYRELDNRVSNMSWQIAPTAKKQKVLDKVYSSVSDEKRAIWRKLYKYRKTGSFDFTEDFERGDMALDFGQVLEIYAKKFDNLTLDAGRVGRPRKRGLKAGTPGAKVSGAKRTKVGQSLLETFGVEAFKVAEPETLTIPFSVYNAETGRSVQGNVVENLEKNIIELTPVSSSNVRASGQFKNELLVQFYPSGLDPQRTYRYSFGTPEEARQAHKALQSSGSPGRWVWENLRGHKAGEQVLSTKLGPSLSPPGLGIPTIGGTSASLVEYKISNRIPVKRVQGFEKMVNLLKRETPNPVQDPNTGARIEKLLGARKELRELNLSPTKVPKHLAQLPRL